MLTARRSLALLSLAFALLGCGSAPEGGTDSGTPVPGDDAGAPMEDAAVAWESNLGDPCTGGSDCTALAPGAFALCIQRLDRVYIDGFCSQYCDYIGMTWECPAGWTCRNSNNIEGNTDQICVPPGR